MIKNSDENSESVLIYNNETNKNDDKNVDKNILIENSDKNVMKMANVMKAAVKWRKVGVY